MSSDACGLCGAGFLSGATTMLNARLPVVGDLGRMSQGQRLLVAAGISVIFMIVLVAIFAIGGAFL